MINPKGQFTVGDSEKHEISYNTSGWGGGFSIFVDGQETYIKNLSVLSQPITIEVGEIEKHTVLIQILIPAIGALFASKKVVVFVDGKLFKIFS